MRSANLLLRFVLELAALVALGYWGLHAAAGWIGILLCIAAPLLFAVLWGLFAAHKAKWPPLEPWKAVVGFVLLEIAALSLALAGQVRSCGESTPGLVQSRARWALRRILRLHLLDDLLPDLPPHVRIRFRRNFRFLVSHAVSRMDCSAKLIEASVQAAV